MKKTTKEAKHAFAYAKDEMISIINATSEAHVAGEEQDMDAALGAETDFKDKDLLKIFKTDSTHSETIALLAEKCKSLPDLAFVILQYGMFAGKVMGVGFALKKMSAAGLGMSMGLEEGGK